MSVVRRRGAVSVLALTVVVLMSSVAVVGLWAYVAASRSPSPLVISGPQQVRTEHSAPSRSSDREAHPVPSATWVTKMAAATGIPARALYGYAAAQLAVSRRQPDCQVGWNTLAALGHLESDHGRHFASSIDDAGWAQPRILGPVLNGDRYAAVRDTDAGTVDGDRHWDRAVGPLQFIPSTWATWGSDGNHDGRRDPDQIDDASLAAARYLCHSGDLAEGEIWRRAVFSFNHSDEYVADIAAVANEYSRLANACACT